MFFANRNTLKNMQFLDKIHTVFTATLSARAAPSTVLAANALYGGVILYLLLLYSADITPKQDRVRTYGTCWLLVSLL